MNSRIQLFLFLSISLFACGQTPNEKQTDSATPLEETSEKHVENETDLAEIRSLIRNAYVWLNTGNPIAIGRITDMTDTKYIGYVMGDALDAAKNMKKTDYFTEPFVANFATIQLYIHQQLGTGKLEWKVGYLPNFGSGANPWCNCQDVPFDEPNPWSLIDIETINLTADEGEFYWKWGNIDPNMGSGWNSFKYRFTVKKVGDKWKIDSLEGLDFDEMTQKMF